MSRQRITIYLIIFVLVLAGCKNKQMITDNVNKDKVSAKNEVSKMDLSYEVEIKYPGINNNNENELKIMEEKNNNDPPKNEKNNFQFGLIKNLPVVPGASINIKATANKTSNLKQNSIYTSSHCVKQIEDNNHYSNRQIVIFIIVLIIFICLSVRNAKKVREKFGG